MTLYTLPVTPDTDVWTQTTDLGGQQFRMRFSWSTREQAWYLDLMTAAGEPLLAGLKLCERVNVLRRFKSANLPPGPLVLIDTSGAGEEPTFDGLGTRWRLFYGAP